ncbi:molybdopterin molybdenumtransferase MoeA [candidate division NPL-UPA2 bacterium]|nr:molybdopterin molybdenumtransferase MoeA [candidate division NPL-UPA2 bacterium]
MAKIKAGFGKLVSLEEAREILFKHAPQVESMEVSLGQAMGFVLAEDVKAEINVPHFVKSAMDSYAVRAEDTFEATDSRPITLGLLGSIEPGMVPERPIGRGECFEIATGAPLPQGADAVVMVEYTEQTRKSENEVKIHRSVAPGANVVEVGSDIEKGKTVLSKGTVLEPGHIGVLAALGRKNIAVRRGVKVGILSTGEEILGLGERLTPGKVYDINYWTIEAALRKENCEVINLGLAKDDIQSLKEKILEGVKSADLVLLSGGSSLGGGDLVGEVIEDLGELLIHGIAVKPGKPTMVGTVQGKLVLGLPGYPMSALSNYYILIEPLLMKMREGKKEPRYIEAKLSRKVASTIGRFEFLPVRLQGREWASPVSKGSSAITSLAFANGFIEIGENVEVLNREEKLR